MTKPKMPRRSQAERTRASKEKIIKAASEFFAQQGYHGTRMADIAKAANLTGPGLLHHFPSKNHLLMAVLAERDRMDRVRFDPAVLSDEGDLLSSLQQLVEFNQTVPGLVQLFTILVAESIQDEHPGHDFFKRRYQVAREQDSEFLRQGQAQGYIRTDIVVEDLVIMLYAMMDGLQIQWLFEPENIDMAHVFGRFVWLLKGEQKPVSAVEEGA